MDTPIITWSIVVGLLSAFMAIKTFRDINSRGGHRHRLFEIGSERDEFYVPGDAIKAEDYEDEDF